MWFVWITKKLTLFVHLFYSYVQAFTSEQTYTVLQETLFTPCTRTLLFNKLQATAPIYTSYKHPHKDHCTKVHMHNDWTGTIEIEAEDNHFVELYSQNKCTLLTLKNLNYSFPLCFIMNILMCSALWVHMLEVCYF